jgi:hypothetical protein
MLARVLLVLCGAMLGLGVVSCAKLEDEDPLAVRGMGQLAAEKARFLNAIPAEYGNLLGVVSRPDHPDWTQAWFMREDKSVVVVWIKAGSGRILDRVLVIPRR